MDKNTLTLEHIDPRHHHLICGLENNDNEILATLSYNARKTNRFVPYRVCDYDAPINFGEMGEFLINGSWTVCEFGGSEWWNETNRIGNATTKSTVRPWTEEQRKKQSERQKGRKSPLSLEKHSEMGKRGGAVTRDSGALQKASVKGGQIQGRRNKGMKWYHYYEGEKIVQKRSHTPLPSPWVAGRGRVKSNQ